MAADLDRAGQDSERRCRPGGSSCRTGVPPGSWSSFAGPEMILSFFVILFMLFDDLGIDC